MKKQRSNALKSALVGMLIALIIMLPLGASAQNANQVYPGVNGPVFDGTSGPCWETTYLSGVYACLNGLGAGAVGVNQGGINLGTATLAPTPAIATSTATTGGTIADGTSYRLATTYITITGGETSIAAAQEGTQTTSGGGLSTITVTAPIAAAGAAGYAVYSTNASGVGNSNTTLTELSQPITTTVCAGAFQVNGPLGPGTGRWVCPFAVNAVFTSLQFTATTATTPNIPGSGPTVANGGLAIPATNTAAYPAAIPETICNFIPLTAQTTSTSTTIMASCPLAANIQNSYGKILHITGHGVFTATGTPTVTISAVEGGITPISIPGKAVTTGGQTNAQFTFDFYLTTSATGTSGTLEAHGLLYAQLASAANSTALATYADTNTAASSAINLTAANTLTLNITGSSGVSASTLRDAQIVLMN